MRIEWDDNALKQIENEVGQQAAKEMQKVVDRVLRAGKGKPVAEVKRMLRREWRTALGGDITDPELTKWAELLAAGHRIVPTPKR